MSDAAELNSLIVSNLADLEAALHQVDDVITPMLAAEVERIATEFMKKHGWGGEVEGLDTLWVAPPAWADPDGDEGDYLCHFELDTVPLAEADTDYLWLSTLTGAGQTTAGLYWASDSISDGKLGKLVEAQPEAIAQLQAAGFVYDTRNKRALYLPVTIDRETLITGLRDGSLDDAVEPIAVALESAARAVPLFASLVASVSEAGA